MEHVTVFREPGHYAGWPANYGIWAWGNEIVVGFTVGYHSSAGGFHARDTSKPFVTMQARSLDGGETWQVGPFPGKTPGGRGLSADEHMRPEMGVGQADLEGALQDCSGGLDFTHPDFALMCARSGLGAGARSWFYVSHDRCNSWQGPYRLPDFGQPGVAARTDYLVNSRDECLLFLTVTKSNGGEGRVLCACTSDGGKTFQSVGWVGEKEPPGFAIMPSSVRLPGGRILTAIRRRLGQRSAGNEHNWIELWASDDGGQKWRYLDMPALDTGMGGNPPAMLRLRDGRLCITYGFRAAPYSIRAVFSRDEGRSWGDEVVLRGDGGCHDLGYTRTVQRPDGKLVTVYYFNDSPEGERYIAATIWGP